MLPEYSALLEFAHFVAREVVNEDFEDTAGSFAEIACRKLHALGIVEEDGDRWAYEWEDSDG